MLVDAGQFSKLRLVWQTSGTLGEPVGRTTQSNSLKWFNLCPGFKRQTFLMSGEATLFYLFSSLALVSAIMVIRAKNPVHSVLFLIFVFCNAAGLLLLLDLDFFAMIFLVVYVGAIAVLFLFVVMMLNIKLAEISENVLRYLPIGGLIGFIFLVETLLVLDTDLIPLLDLSYSQQGLKAVSLSYQALLTLWVGFFVSSICKLPSMLFSLDNLRLDWQELSSDLGWLNKQYELNQAVDGLLNYLQWSIKINQATNIEALGQVIYTYYVVFFILASLVLLVAMIGVIVLTMHKGIAVKRQEVFEQNTREFAKTIQKVRT
jgi:NADH:ubiquinone oxidoreductase subunit 6 (subunit J)